MKARVNIALLAGFFASLVLGVLLVSWTTSIGLSEQRLLLLLYFPVVPAFFLQLLLCRLQKLRWIRWLPLCALLLVAIVGASCLFQLVGSGWGYTMGGGILLCLCIAPATGCALGWIANGEKLSRRLGAAGLCALLAIYSGLRIMSGPIYFELTDLPAVAALAMGTWLLLRKEIFTKKSKIEK